MLKFMNVASISECTFYCHTSSYVNPVIIQQWREHQEQILDSLCEKEGGLVLAGDGRCDSPGYSAKFGSFTFIEEQINRVVDFQLVQVGFVSFSSFGLLNSFCFISNQNYYYQLLQSAGKDTLLWVPL